MEFLTVKNSTISNGSHVNGASTSGGIYVAGGNVCDSEVNIENCIIKDSNAGSGGGVYASTNTTVSLAGDVKISGNTKGGSANNAYFGKENVTYNGNTYPKGSAITTDIQ